MSVKSGKSRKSRKSGAFRHEALLYADEDEFLQGTLEFVRSALESNEPIFVVLGAAKNELLRGELGADAVRVRFADMAEVGANPARIIPAWHDFVDEQRRDGRIVRGIGEPIWKERSPAELVECQRHESLLNLAFADGPAWHLLCPYDTSALGDEVITEALRSHPGIVQQGAVRPSDAFAGLDEIEAPFDDPLPAPAAGAEMLSFTAETLPEARRLLYRRASDAGLSAARVSDLVVAGNEITTNSVRHGGGAGVLRVWQDDETLFCEVSDGGRIDEPLVGRRRPGPIRPTGRGLWIANQLCDLVQVRCFADDTTVRLHVGRAHS